MSNDRCPWRSTVSPSGPVLGALAEHVHPRVALRAGVGDVPVLAAEPLPGPGEEVVVEGRVLAAIDRPEERVAQAHAADRRRAVGRQQESGRPVLVVDRIVERRQVEERDVLHAQHHVLEEGMLAGHEGDLRGAHVPPRRGLAAAGEPAVRKDVRVIVDLLDRVGPEDDVRLLRAEQAPVRGLGQELHPAGRLEERAEMRAAVHLRPFGRDLRPLLVEVDVTRGVDHVRIVPPVNLLGLQRHLVADDPHVPREPAFVDGVAAFDEQIGEALLLDEPRLAGGERV